jgi:hypothetical protein
VAVAIEVLNPGASKAILRQCFKCPETRRQGRIGLLPYGSIQANISPPAQGLPVLLSMLSRTM